MTSRAPLLVLAALLASCAPTGAPEPGAAADTAALSGRSAPQLPTPPPGEPPSAGELVLHADGFGPLRIVMTRAEVVAALGEDARPDRVSGAEPTACAQWRPERAPEGVLVMIEGDRLTRVTVRAGTAVRSPEGFGVGDPARAVEAAYGPRAEVTPHKYAAAPAGYITVWTRRPGTAQWQARGLRYEVGPDGRVTHMHGGGESILYVEGCS